MLSPFPPQGLLTCCSPGPGSSFSCFLSVWFLLFYRHQFRHLFGKAVSDHSC